MHVARQHLNGNQANEERHPNSFAPPVSGRAIAPEDAAAVVDVGGQIRFLCSGGHIEQLENELLAAEGSGSGVVAESTTLDTWSQGPKTMLYIRVRFADQTSDPQTHVGGIR